MNINEVVLRDALLRLGEKVRNEFKDRDIGGSFTVKIEIAGQIQSGGLKVEFIIDCLAHSGVGIEGKELGPTVRELLRRMGWDKENTPLMIEAPPAPATLEF